MRQINKIIVHCTDTPAGRPHTVADIDRWHRERNFRSIGYHYVVYLDGSVNRGRPDNEIGAHVLGHNVDSIGVVYVGGRSADMQHYEDTRTPAQKTALLSLLKELKRRYPVAKIYGHRDFANKECPCFDAQKEYQDI